MERKILFLLFLLIFAFMLTGCWDRVEIEEFGFVLGVAFDPVENEEQHKAQIEQETGEGIPADHLFRVSYQIAIPGLLARAENGGVGSDEPYYNIVSMNITNMDAVRSAAAKFNHSLNFEHLKVYIIHEELVRQGMLKHLVDFYIRDHNMRRRTFVFVSKGDAKTLLEQPVPMEDVPSMFIEMMAENEHRVLQMPRHQEIGEISQRLIDKRSYIIPRITTAANGEEYILAGAAVIRGTDNKMVGWFGEYDVQGYNWVVGEAENGVLEVKTDHEDLKGTYIVFEIERMDTKVNYKRKNGQDDFEVNIKAEGVLVESWLQGVEINDEQTLELLEAEIEHKIEKQARDVIAKSQHEFHTDVFGFIEQVKLEEYDYWEEVREKWPGPDGEFQHAHVSVNADVQLRHFMLQEKVE